MSDHKDNLIGAGRTIESLEASEVSRSLITEMRARIAVLEAELAKAMTAVGLTGYDHRPDVNTPEQAIYALWADHTNLRELHAMQEAALAAAHEQEAALAAKLCEVVRILTALAALDAEEAQNG